MEKKIADGLEQVDWNRIFVNLGKLISTAIGSSIDLLAGISESSKNADEGKGKIEKLIPDTLWEWIQIGSATIGLDIEYAVNGVGTVPWWATEKNPQAKLGITFDEDGWNSSAPQWLRDVLTAGFTTYGLESIRQWTENLATNAIAGWTDAMESWINDFEMIETWYSEKVAPWFSKEKWIELAAQIGLGLADGFSQAINPIKDIINLWITLFNGFINGVIGGINAIISSLNSLKITVPDWVTVATGFSGFGFDIPKLSSFTIPKLAQGGVIPPNKEFMAILGDQTSGVNIETPLQTMIDAFNTALNNRGGGNGNGTINLSIDGQTFARITLDSYFSEMNRQGYNVAVLGG